MRALTSTDLTATVLLLVGAVLALPSVLQGYRAVHGLEVRPWERRTGPFGAIAVALAGILVLLPAVLGVVELLTVGSIDESRWPLLSGVVTSASSAVVLLCVSGARASRGRGGSATVAVERARRSLLSLTGGALLCGTAILLV